MIREKNTYIRAFGCYEFERVSVSMVLYFVNLFFGSPDIGTLYIPTSPEKGFYFPQRADGPPCLLGKVMDSFSFSRSWPVHGNL